MKIVSLGGSPLKVSWLAYGCWRLAGNGVDGSAAIMAAVDAGFTLFDHADIYGGGECEAIFGRVMKASPDLRGRIVIASKCGIRLPHLGGAGEPYRYDSRADYIVASCEDSLRRLNVEKIDLYQIHRPDFLVHPEEVAAAFEALAAAGKVGEFGVSNFRPRQLSALQQACPMRLRVNQIELSILQRDPLSNGVLDQCLADHITPLAWSPLGGGQLADGAGDLLQSQKSYQPQRVLPLLDEIAARYNATRSQIALAWLLKHPAGVIPIVGSTNRSRIINAAQSDAIDLSREEWYSILSAADPDPLP